MAATPSASSFANQGGRHRRPHYAVGMVYSLPELAPGASAAQEDILFAGPQEENKARSPWRRAWSW